jgi:plasmid stabilization system protein ParE
MLPVIWREPALESLDAILAFIVVRNEFAAYRLQGEIEQSTLSLAEYPYLGRAGRVSGTRELVVNANYVIVYEVALASIDILDVLHTRQEYPY